MNQMRLREYKPQHPGYGPRVPKDKWELYRPYLTDLNRQGLSRKEIIKRAKDEYGFEGTYSALNTRFKAWGLTRSGREGSMDAAQDDAESVDDQQLEICTGSSLGSSPAAMNHTKVAQSDIQDDMGTKGRRPDLVDESSNLPEETKEKAKASEPVNPSALPAAASENHELSANGILAAEEPVAPDATEVPELSEHSEVTVPPYAQVLAEGLKKRPRSEASSIRSSKFSISSSARSFVQLAKRLRRSPPSVSATSLSSHFSDALSRKSQEYLLFSGLTTHLEPVHEDSENWLQGQVSPRKLLRRRQARDLLRWTQNRDPTLIRDEKILAQLDQIIQEGTNFPQTPRSRTQLQKALSAEYGEGVFTHEFLRYNDVSDHQKATIHSLLQEFLPEEISYELDTTKQFLLLWLSPSPRNWTTMAQSSPLRGFIRPLRYYFEFPCVYIRFGFYGGHKAAFRLNSSVLKIWPTSLGRRPSLDEQAAYDKHPTWPNIVSPLGDAHDSFEKWAPPGYVSVVSLDNS